MVFPDLAVDKIDDPVLAFDHIQNMNALKNDNEKEKRRTAVPPQSQNQPERASFGDDYVELFNYLSLLDHEIAIHDKKIEEIHLRAREEAAQIQNIRKEEEAKQREMILAARSRDFSPEMEAQKFTGSPLAGAVQGAVNTGAGNKHDSVISLNHTLNSDVLRNDPGVLPSTVHPELATTVNAYTGPSRPVMRQNREDYAGRQPHYIPEKQQNVDNRWHQSSKAGGMTGQSAYSAQNTVVQNNVPHPGGDPQNVSLQNSGYQVNGSQQISGNYQRNVQQQTVRQDNSAAGQMNYPQNGFVSQQGNAGYQAGRAENEADIQNIPYADEPGGEDIPMPVLDDFASDSDDDTDRQNSLVYTTQDLSGAISQSDTSGERSPSHHDRLINGRKIITPLDLICEVDDAYTQDLVASGVGMENLVILNSGVRDSSSTGNDWLIKLPQSMSAIISRNVVNDMQKALSEGLQRDIKLEFSFVDQDVLPDSPDELDRICYEQHMDEQYQTIVGSAGFDEVLNSMGLDLSMAHLELVQPEEQAGN